MRQSGALGDSAQPRYGCIGDSQGPIAQKQDRRDPAARQMTRMSGAGVSARRSSAICAAVSQARPSKPHQSASTAILSPDALIAKTVPLAGSLHSSVATARPGSARPSSRENQCATAAPQAMGSTPALPASKRKGARPCRPDKANGSSAKAASAIGRRTDAATSGLIDEQGRGVHAIVKLGQPWHDDNERSGEAS